MFGFIFKIFVWWKDVMFGMLLIILLCGGKLVGKDEFGNKYYEEKGVIGLDGNKCCWVIYNGYVDVFCVLFDWYGWMYYIFEYLLIEVLFKCQIWEKDYYFNLIGMVYVYCLLGLFVCVEDCQVVFGDYEVWKLE